MLIIPLYLLRQFLAIFVICFVSLIGLYIVIDLFGHLDHFTSYSEKNGNLLGVIARYYAYHSLSFFDAVSGLLAMISAMFTVAWLARHQEMTALLAAGISKFRVIRPLLIAAAGVSLLGVFNREVIIPIPSVREELTKTTKDLGGGAARALEPQADGTMGFLIGGQKVMLEKKDGDQTSLPMIVQPTFILQSPRLIARYGKQFTAERAYYLEEAENRPAGFVLHGVSAPGHLGKLASLLDDGKPVVLTPKDYEWLGSDELFVTSTIDFPALIAGTKYRTYATMPELISALQTPSANAGADVRVAIHTRILQFFMDGTLVMLGLPVMLSRRSRNVYVAIGICLLVATLFMISALACQSLGSVNVIRPVLAAWLPLLVFAPLAAAMSQSLRT
jgi:lipopolysaccharide export system permease protein